MTGVESGSQPTATKKTGTSVLQLQGYKFYQQPKGDWEPNFPWSSLQMKTQLANILILALDPGRVSRIPDPQKLGKNFFLWFQAATLVVICYIAIERKQIWQG